MNPHTPDSTEWWAWEHQQIKQKDEALKASKKAQRDSFRPKMPTFNKKGK